jgi:hypothetical protein
VEAELCVELAGSRRVVSIALGAIQCKRTTPADRGILARRFMRRNSIRYKRSIFEPQENVRPIVVEDGLREIECPLRHGLVEYDELGPGTWPCGIYDTEGYAGRGHTPAVIRRCTRADP